MKIAVMQPYFFPYIGYFSLIKVSDLFILFDTPQYIRHGWIERNRILKIDGQPLYIKIPLMKHSRQTSIKEITINQKEKWQSKIIAQLAIYKKKAPHYYAVIDLVNELFKIQTDDIVELNYHALKLTCNYLNIETPIKIWSKMDINIQNVSEPDEWALNICKSLNANTYYNPIGGLTFFNREKYELNNIKIHFLESLPMEYRQLGNFNFVPFLSIIDVMMFNDKNDIHKMIDNYLLK
ncbi:MAG: WbqC family protein [Flavobacteriales bacterium]|nr:WbqC family protein [Flavobacteriales bacterium]MCB9499644.1 WbqC family protein [Erysipelotrichaceae bacterium]